MFTVFNKSFIRTILFYLSLYVALVRKKMSVIDEAVTYPSMIFFSESNKTRADFSRNGVRFSRTSRMILVSSKTVIFLEP